MKKWVLLILIVLFSGGGLYFLLPNTIPFLQEHRVAMIILGLFLVLVGAVLLLVLVVGGEVRLARIMVTGEPAQALVLDVIDTGVMLNDMPKLKFVLKVTVPGRDEYRTEVSEFVARPHIGAIHKGQVIAIKIDPQDPQSVAIDWDALSGHHGGDLLD